jgi:protein required for attachment to host cells
MTNHSIDRPRPEWVLVANAARARCFERDTASGTLRELADFVHPRSRMKGGELCDDRPGHAIKGQASTQFEPRTDVATKEHAAFAREIAAFLDAAALAHRFDRLVLLASSAFLGELRTQLAPATRDRLRAGIARDLTGCSGRELQEGVTSALADA